MDGLAICQSSVRVETRREPDNGRGGQFLGADRSIAPVVRATSSISVRCFNVARSSGVPMSASSSASLVTACGIGLRGDHDFLPWGWWECRAIVWAGLVLRE